MYHNILIPTDGSEIANTAVDHALDLAERYDAAIHTLYVVDIDAMGLGLGVEQIDRIQSGQFKNMPELQKRVRNATDPVVDRGRDRGLEVTDAVVAGRPHTEIANYATKHGIDLIVMGSAGRGGVRRALLGSVAERTLRSADCPVLVVGPQ